MKRLNNSGSHVVALLFGVLVVGVIAFAGYTVSQRSKDTSTTASTTSVSKTAAAPTTIQSNADLTQAAKALDDSSSQVDSNLNDASLNGDLNDLL